MTWRAWRARGVRMACAWRAHGMCMAVRGVGVAPKRAASRAGTTAEPTARAATVARTAATSAQRLPSTARRLRSGRARDRRLRLVDVRLAFTRPLTPLHVSLHHPHIPSRHLTSPHIPSPPSHFHHIPYPSCALTSPISPHTPSHRGSTSHIPHQARLPPAHAAQAATAHRARLVARRVCAPSMLVVLSVSALVLLPLATLAAWDARLWARAARRTGAPRLERLIRRSASGPSGSM